MKRNSLDLIANLTWNITKRTELAAQTTQTNPVEVRPRSCALFSNMVSLFLNKGSIWFKTSIYKNL